MTDKEGNTTYSHIVKLYFSSVGFTISNVYPQPTTGNTVMIEINVAEKTNAQAIITNLQGKNIANISIQLQKGINAIALPLSNIAAGNYFIKLVAHKHVSNTVGLFKN
jgi:hypothetical protein